MKLSKTILGKIIVALSVICILVIASIYLAGSLLIAPQQRLIGRPPSNLPLVEVSFQSESQSTVKGWWLSQSDPRGNILLLHGIRADRRSMLSRAEFLSVAGYNVLLIDLQAHGESLGSRITLGKLESLDVAAAVTFLSTEVPNVPIAIIGMSLGGASAILCKSEVEVKAVIAEAVFPSPDKAIANRLKIKLGPLGNLLSPLLIHQIPWRLDCELEEISPIEQISKLNSAVFIINGSEDRRTTVAESRALYQRAPEPKELWIVESAAHVNLHAFAGAEYEQRILTFLRSHL